MTASLPGQYSDATIVSILTPRQLHADGPIVVNASVTRDDDWLHIELIHRSGGMDVKEQVSMRMPGLNEPADLADMRAVTIHASGDVVRALAIGEGSPPETNGGILAVPSEVGVVVAFDGSTRTVSIETGQPWVGRQGTVGMQGLIDIVSP